MNEAKILFQQFLIDKKVYNLNVGYWRKQLQKALGEKIGRGDQFVKNKNSLGKSYYDGNPIYSYYHVIKRKAIRIIQEDPSQLVNFENIQLLEGWIGKIDLSVSESQDQEVPELVLSLFLTKSTVTKSVQLAKEWFTGDLHERNIKERLKLA